MISLRVTNNKNEEVKGRSKKNKDSFREHDEIMKKFRKAHTELELRIAALKDLTKTCNNLLVPVDPDKPEIKG